MPVSVHHNTDSAADLLLPIALSAAVNLRILELKRLPEDRRPSLDDFVPCLECHGDPPHAGCFICGDEGFMPRKRALSQYIASRGDNILFRSKKKGETAKAFNALAESLAYLALYQGGVDFMGMHFEACAQEVLL